MLAEDAHLFTLRPAEQVRYFNPKAHQGDMVFRGENPPAGAIDYFTGRPAANASIVVLDAAGQQVVTLQAPQAAGINRVMWNLRYPALPAAPSDDESGGAPGAMPGPLVIPGEYTVRLTALGRTSEQKLLVKEDPRIQIAPADRKAWTDALLSVAELYRSAVALREQLSTRGAAADARDAARELQTRLATLYRQMTDPRGGRPPINRRDVLSRSADSLQRRIQ